MLATVSARGPSLPAALDPCAGGRMIVGYGVDVDTAGILAIGLQVPCVRGWAAAISGDPLWFAILLGTSLAAASIADDDRFIALVMIVAIS